MHKRRDDSYVEESKRNFNWMLGYPEDQNSSQSSVDDSEKIVNMKFK